MNHIDGYSSATDLFGNYRIQPAKSGQSERGGLLEYFASKTGWPIKRLVYKLAGLELQDLYFLKSNADAYEREGKGAWSKAFFGSLKVVPTSPDQALAP